MSPFTPKIAVLAPVIHAGDEKRSLFGAGWSGLAFDLPMHFS